MTVPGLRSSTFIAAATNDVIKSRNQHFAQIIGHGFSGIYAPRISFGRQPVVILSREDYEFPAAMLGDADRTTIGGLDDFARSVAEVSERELLHLSKLAN